MELTSQPNSSVIFEINFSFGRSHRQLSVFFDGGKHLLDCTFLRLNGIFIYAPPLLDSSTLEVDC